jgi:flagellar FliJ protein
MVEDELKQELSDIRDKVLREKQLLTSLKRKEMKTVQALKEEQVSGISSQQVITYHNYLERLFKRISEQEKAVEDRKAEEEQKQSEMIEAVKKRKILEKLKAQGIDRYRQLILDQETKFIDEISVNQFARNSRKLFGENE